MSKFLQRTIGILLILTSIGGLAFSIFATVSVWRLKPKMTESLTNSVKLASDTLEATATGLAVIDESLSGAVNSMQALRSALDTTADTIQSTEPMLGTVIELMETGLPDTIRATQTSLDSAQSSAKIIDSVLNALKIFPFISYDPEKPLHESLTDISDKLGEFPASFLEISGSLDDSRSQLEVLQADLGMISAAISQIESSLEQSDSVLAQYQVSVETTLSQLDALEARIPTLIDSGVWAATLFLVWMAFAQIGLFTQGVELWNIKEPSTIVSADLPEKTPEES